MNNKRIITMDLKFFGENGKDFFTNAYNEAYNIVEGETDVVDSPSDAVEEPESVSNVEEVETPVEQEETPYKPSKEEIKAMYEEYYGKPQEVQNTPEPQIDEETKSALELYKYLEENPHLVQAMREVDGQGYEKLNSYVPDEVTKRLQELEDFVQEQQYNAMINNLKSKYNDFDEDKVLEYAEKHEVYDLEVAYKAMKSENVETPNMEELRKQLREEIKKELEEELKQNSLNTQSIIGGIEQKPSNHTEVNLSAKERRIARAMGVSDEEYAKWR